MYYYEQLAQKGDADAQNTLGVYHSYDWGPVTEDSIRTYAWISLAAAQGHTLAAENKLLLETKMSSEVVSRQRKFSIL